MTASLTALANDLGWWSSSQHACQFTFEQVQAIDSSAVAEVDVASCMCNVLLLRSIEHLFQDCPLRRATCF